MKPRQVTRGRNHLWPKHKLKFKVCISWCCLWLAALTPTWALCLQTPKEPPGLEGTHKGHPALPRHQTAPPYASLGAFSKGSWSSRGCLTTRCVSPHRAAAVPWARAGPTHTSACVGSAPAEKPYSHSSTKPLYWGSSHGHIHRPKATTGSASPASGGFMGCPTLH